jgi:uncharacterized DUF497 family protein
MSFEWDETKCDSNLLKHGVDFRRAVQISRMMGSSSALT